MQCSLNSMDLRRRAPDTQPVPRVELVCSRFTVFPESYMHIQSCDWKQRTVAVKADECIAARQHSDRHNCCSMTEAGRSFAFRHVAERCSIYRVRLVQYEAFVSYA